MINQHVNDLSIQTQVDYIDLIKNFRTFWEFNSEPWGAKDLNSRFIYANKAYYDLINIPHYFNLDGRYDSEIPAVTSEFSADFQLHDKKVIVANKSISSLEIHAYGKYKEIEPYIFEKYPLIYKGIIVGTIFHGKKTSFFSTEMLLSSQTPTSFMFNPPNDHFSEKEWAVIFFLNQRHTSKEIAKKMSISPRTVQNHIQNIYRKSGVNTLNAFIDYCREYNYEKYVPRSILKPTHKIFY